MALIHQGASGQQGERVARAQNTAAPVPCCSGRPSFPSLYAATTLLLLLLMLPCRTVGATRESTALINGQRKRSPVAALHMISRSSYTSRVYWKSCSLPFSFHSMVLTWPQKWLPFTGKYDALSSCTALLFSLQSHIECPPSELS